MLGQVFGAFVKESPISVMMRGLMECVFKPERINAIFERNAQMQYTRELLFSDLVNVLSLVVCGIHPSVNAAYKAKAEQINVERSAFYRTLNGVEIEVSAALLRETAAELKGIIEQMGGQSPPLLPGYGVRILDGNALAATEHRLEVLRTVGSAPLPGKSLVVLDPQYRLAVDLFPCEDGHAQERRLFPEVLNRIEPGQLWIAERNMCTLDFLLGIDHRQAAFVIREHQKLPWTAVSELVRVGHTTSGEMFEQRIQLQKGTQSLELRRVVLRLDQPNRHGDREIVCLTNLAADKATIEVVLKLYRDRWQVDGLFLSVTENFEGEIKTLAYPKAALLNFTLALVAYNILATIKAALASVHGVGKIEASLSAFYVVDELQGTYRGMMIAIAPEHWSCFNQMSRGDLAHCLQELAAGVKLTRFLKQPRAKKKKKTPRKADPKHPHVSTAKLLSSD